MSDEIICPVCEESFSLEVTYPNLEMVGHFINSHPTLLKPEQRDASHWEDRE